MSLFKKLTSFVLSACLTLSAAAVGTIAISAPVNAVTPAYGDYGLMATCQEGTILHCFDWKYTDIMAELPNIAAAGFTSVQTSPAQPGGNNDPTAVSGTWWWLYQPLSFSIGTNYLGTKEELTQLCTEAHKYGIKVIVDIVANHLAGSHDNIQEDLKPKQYWHKVEDWNNCTDKRYKTTHKDLGMPDIASENSYVQTCVKNYIQELKNVGVDGLRWDTLKHIQLPSEDCAFFNVVLDSSMYNYGESLGDPGGNSDAQNRALMTEYTGLMSVTDDVYGNKIRKSFAAGTMASDLLGNWCNRGMNANKLVYWAESHDTWSNGEDGNGESTNVSQDVIDRVYAITASRADATSLYFSRPSEKKKDLILAGVKGSTHFTSPQVAAVNHFHNAFNGQSECVSSQGNIAYVERGTKGVVIAKIDGAGEVRLNANKMLDGTYTDHVSGGTFTVANGVISGTVNDTGIAVVYNENDVEDNTVVAIPSKLYLETNMWNADNARFSMYLWQGNSNTWVDMTDTDGDGVYEAAVPSGHEWTNVIFCRVDPNGTNSNKWKNVWNQTQDLNVYTDGRNLCTITDWTVGNWGIYSCSHTFARQAPDWVWDGIFSATATLNNCTKCGKSHVYPAEITSTVDDTNITYKATVTVKETDNSFCRYSYNYTVPAKEISLKPSDNWKQASARFAVYLWDSSNHNMWVDLTDSDNDGIYSAKIAKNTWTNAMFCRMNGSTTENTWSNKWNATDNLTIPVSDSPLYTVTSSSWDGNIGSWSDPNCTHTFSEQPSWKWNGVSSAAATFTCSLCGAEESFDAAVTSTETDESVIYTAKVVVNGVSYTNTITVDKQEDTVIYLDLNREPSWLSDGARFAVRIKNETTGNDTWVDMSDPDGDNIYFVKIPDGTWDSIIFCRMDGTTTENNWDNRWNNTLKQSNFLTLGNYFTITGGSGNEYIGTWDTYVHAHSYGEPVWTWADDHSSAAVSLTCTVCGRTVSRNADVTSSAVNGTITYTASVIVDNQQYTDSVSVSDNLETFLTKCEAYKKLSDDHQSMYRDILSFVRSVVRGEQTSSVFTFTPKLNITWTWAELGLDSSASDNQIFNAITPKISSEMNAVFNALLVDCPYELYWFAQTQGFSYQLSNFYFVKTQTTIALSNQPLMIVTMQVSEHYQGDTTTSFNTSAINNVKRTVPALAKNIVDQYADVSDYEKLKGYANMLCQLTDYNDDAKDGKVDAYDLDPWQLVYVFDNDDTTMVVCEGYSKAFKYLCDLTEFDSELIKCYLVSGHLGGFTDENFSSGAHMWNIVTMNDGKNYLVDVTNSDECTGRTYTAFLLNGGTLNSDWYQISSRSAVSDILYFRYDDETQDIWGSDILTLSSTNYKETFSITIGDAANGTVEADAATAAYGENVTLTVKANAGYMIGSVTYNDTVIEPVDGVYSFSMPNQNVVVSASFIAKTDISSAVITLNESSFIYDGTQKTVTYTATLDGKTLILGTDYTFEGDLSAADPGTYIVKIKGINSYCNQAHTVWTIVPPSISVTIDGQAVTQPYQYNQSLTVTAPAAKAGEKFSYWQVNGSPVSYSEQYSFIVKESVNLIPVYVSDQTNVEQQAVLNIKTSQTTYNGKNAVKYTFNHSLPEGYTVQEVGLLYATNKLAGADTKKSGYAVVNLVNDKSFGVEDVEANVKNNSTGKIKQFVAKYKNRNGTITFSYAVGNNTTAYTYAVGYIKALNSNNESVTLYSNFVAVNYENA